ncbi:MAG: MBL fold metallo-hydrolase [Anaerolineae bacterium]|nr:MBL fold metallo-hydrolase [Anaerolineae bacterium]
MAKEDRFTSKYFALDRLAEGVWATLSTGRMAFSNAGIIDIGGRTLVFDALNTPSGGADLCAAAEALTGRRPAVLINSHWHDDHYLGNQAFPAETPILCTTRTRELIIESIDELLEEIPAYVEITEKELADLRAKRESEQDAAARAALDTEIWLTEKFLAEAPNIAPRIPDQTFEKQVTFYGEQRRAELITFGRGHTDSDAILWLPDDGIVFAGDLLFCGRYPWAGHSDPGAWLERFDDLDRLAPAVVVPGHGPLATPAAFDDSRTFLKVLQGAFDDLIAGRLSVDDIDKITVPPEIAHIPGDATRYQNNLRELYEQANPAPGS